MPLQILPFVSAPVVYHVIGHFGMITLLKDLGFPASYYVRLPEGNLLPEIMMNLRLPTRRFLVQLWHQWQRSNLPRWSTHWEAFQKRCPLDDFWKKDMDIIERATCSSNKSLHNVFGTLSLFYTCMYLGHGTPGIIEWLGGFLHICGQSTDGMTSLMSLCFEGMFLGAVETFFLWLESVECILGLKRGPLVNAASCVQLCYPKRMGEINY